MGRKKKLESKILTETELKIMNIIWTIGEGTVHNVLELLGNEYAYNTVSTILRVLEQKEFLTSRKDGRSHIYSPQMEKETYEKIGIDNMVDGLFGGTPLALMKSMIGSGSLSDSELSELKNLLKDR